MRFDIMTLFPEYVDGILNESIIGRARKSGAIRIFTHNIRDYSEDKHRKVDDTPYGGGKGMLIAAPPIYNCYKAILGMIAEDNGGADCSAPHTVYMSPKGRVFNQKIAAEFYEKYDNLIILCGHYEGVDQRIIDEIVDEEISLGDFVLTGGEIPACVLTDCVSRLVPGVLSSDECYENESFSYENGEEGVGLEYPQYTRPYEFHGVKVPDVLISGHHENIEKWRRDMSRKLTADLRPDLIDKKD